MALPRNRESMVEISESTKRRYFINLHEQLQNLRHAMEKSDFSAVAEICHRVRGSANLFGLKDLGEACQEMEEAAVHQDPERMVEEFQVIEVIISRNAISEAS